MNPLYPLLEQYLSQHSDKQWSCASMVTKSAFSYRWPGAMMMFSPWGKSYGLVSGGCLESDVIGRGQMRQTDYVIYDTADEDSFAANLGLGSNGKIGILIQAISPKHHELLVLLYHRMQNKQASYLLQCYQAGISNHVNHWVLLGELSEILTSSDESEKPQLTIQKLVDQQVLSQFKGIYQNQSLCL